MAKFQIQDLDGTVKIVEANSPEEADAALDEMQGSAGQPHNFDQAFAEGRPENMAAQRPELEDAMNAPADWRGRVATAGNAMSWGGFDEIMGLVEGGLEFARGGSFKEGQERMQNQVRDDIAGYAARRPNEHMALDFGASIPSGGVLFRKAIEKGGPVVGSGAGGGIYGTVRGGLEGEDGPENRGMSAFIGGVTGTVTGLGAGKLGQVIGNRAGRKVGAANASTRKDVKAESQKFFKQAEDSGVGFGPSAVVKVDNIKKAMLGPNENFPKLLPKSHDNALGALGVLDRFSRTQVLSVGGKPTIQFGDIMTIRGNIQDFADAAKKGSKDEAATLRILDAFDDWTKKLQPRDVTAGKVTAKEAFQMWTKAKELWGQQARTSIIEKMVEKAKKKTAGSFGNAAFAAKLRKDFADLAADERRIKWFSPEERKAIEWASKGGNMGKTLGAIDALTPGLSSAARAGRSGAYALGGGTAIALGSGGAAIPIMAAAQVAGTGSRIARNIGTKNAANTVQNMVRGGGKVPFDAKAAEASADNWAARLSQASVPAIQQQFRPVYTTGGGRGGGGGGGG